MKILQINKFFYDKGGSERYMFGLSENLEKRGHRVIYFSMHDRKNKNCEQSEYFADFINVRHISLSSAIKIFHNQNAARNLQRLIDKEKPDIAHLHNYAHQLSPSIILVLEKNRIPMVQTMHDYKAICPNYRLFSHRQVCIRCMDGKYYNCFLGKCVQDSYLKSLAGAAEAYYSHNVLRLNKKINAFIAPSQFMKKTCELFGMNGDNIYVVTNPVEKIEIDRSAIVRQNEDYFLYFGRLSEEKGVDILINAMYHCPKKIK